MIGSLQSFLVPAEQVAADTGRSQQVEQGKALFAIGCASCHGLDAQGTKFGPVLVGVGAAAVDFQVASGRMPMATEGNQAFPKERQFDEEETAALAAYVASLGPGPAIPSPEQYEPNNPDAAEVARGGELFRTNCSACHNFAGAGGALPEGRVAPSLFDVSNRHLYEAMTTGPGQMPVFSDSVLRPQDKRELIAYLNALHEQPAEGGLDLGGLGPVSEGFWAWIVGMGGLVAFAVWIAAKGSRAA
jgi:ubiquinol-cytochrome c reductase cytochrome c subunit